ncbi:MFS transporter [Lentilactobacillus hilgardii]|uniref:MFS transporter n=1 Tax=Lentilactobacillus hilgardii TaxID=1588 RepID=A0A6P1E5J5_LENHI|nr:MFS transporter [Lentilactobacillus hilgardii]QHB50955.1 MFS transporter [Lentilactobacillus hilgardii]RRG08068.1 MAG: MFS transporter [Lactobacillus sp.]
MDGNIQNIDAKSKAAVNVSRRYWWKVVALCFVGWILIYADRTILNPVQEQIGAQFHIGNTQLGLVNSIFFLTYAICQIPFGILGDRVGRRLVIMGGFIVLGIMTFFSGFAFSFGIFLLFRALAGAGQGTYYGPQYALSTEAIPTKDLTLGTAIINSGMAFGTSGGYLLSSSMVLQHGMAWQTPFYVMALPTIIVGVLFYVVLKEKVIRPEDQGNTEKTAEVKKSEESKVQLKDLFKNRNLVFAFILCFCSIYANFVILTWLPQFLQVERGFQGSSVGFISSLVPWASIPGAIVFARIYDKLKKTKLMIAFLVPISLVAVFGIAFVTNKLLLIVLLIVYGLTGKLAIDPILVAFVTKNSPRGSLSTALSAYNFIGMSGSILAPYLTGWISDQFGSMQIGFYLAAVLLLVGLVLFTFTNDKKNLVQG